MEILAIIGIALLVGLRVKTYLDCLDVAIAEVADASIE
jgi:hypothetical protein